ncbi:MAG TPA: SCP2 sterol-binding domain-containing protein [Aquihabitans sp.]|jgi:hypothetical protein|nr:SCP2 sterol-binding domain-containing protein [Aquihabitans sp.]
MLAFLSPAWVAALHDAASRDQRLAAAAGDVSLVVEQHVTGGPAGNVTYHVVLDHGRVAVAHGPAPAPGPDLRLVQDHATAVGIADGTGSAQRAFMAGRLRVGGDLRALLRHQEVLAGLHDVFAEVRATTDLGSNPAPVGGEAV